MACSLGGFHLSLGFFQFYLAGLQVVRGYRDFMPESGYFGLGEKTGNAREQSQNQGSNEEKFLHKVASGIRIERMDGGFSLDAWG